LGSLATASSVVLTNIASIANNTLLGNNSGSSASPTALSVSNVQTLLGLGSAAYLTAGTSANNVVQLNSSGFLPSVVAGNGIHENPNTISSSYTIVGTNNAVSIGDIAISGASTTLTLQSNSQWKII